MAKINYFEYIDNKLECDGVDKSVFLGSAIISQNELADFTVPCFKFSKALRRSPMDVANTLAKLFENDPYFESVSVANGYLNFKIDKTTFIQSVIDDVLNCDFYGASDFGQGKTICLDYSSINIAKPFHIGHLSTTVIGASLARVYKCLGYHVVSINHLGDWGTQFGKLISAFKRWGDKDKIEKGGVREMLKIYVKFHDEADKDDSLNEEARMYFKRIEDGCAEELELFHWFKDLTLKEVGKIYDRLGITFDSYDGESFYNDKMDTIIDELDQKGLLTLSNGAKVVDLSEYKMPPCLIVKGDGATLYATRDLAAAEYRSKTYHFEKCLYVVAYQQNLHFQQIFKVMELMGKDYANKVEHVAFGMVSLENLGSLSTRHGNVVFLEDVLDKCVEKARDIIEAKSPDLENKEDVARIVGTGAVVFSALINNRIKDIVFSYEKVLSFEGESAPYMQYTYARANSVVTKAGVGGKYVVPHSLSESEFELAKAISQIPDILLALINKNEPSFLTRQLLDIAKWYNKFYFDCRIIGEEENVKNFRLALTNATKKVLKEGLSLLGIEVPEKM
ncbi:MAG: arginine--tRNA ligase [Clostridia bacterium]